MCLITSGASDAERLYGAAITGHHLPKGAELEPGRRLKEKALLILRHAMVETTHEVA